MYDIAASVIESAISSTSEESDLLHYQLGYVYDSADRTEDAERELRRAIEINPDNYFALNHLGYMFTEENINLEEALELTQRAVELSDQDTANGFNNGFIVDSLGWAHYRLGNSAEAVEWLQEAIRRSASDGIQDGLFFEHLGDALLIDGRGGEAIEAWEQAFNLYRSTEDLESALSVADKILSEEPDNPSIAGAVEEIRAEEISSQRD
jgi:tetratricopeptide (TPR) repeat protein